MSKSQKTTILVLVAGSFLSVLNQTLLNPALPSIMADLAISATTAQWLVSGFTLVNAIVVAISAFLMDKIKTKPLFIGSFSLFLVGSLLCAWGANFPMLLIGRFLQAICAGIMIPLSMTMLLIIFPQKKRGSAMGIFSFVIMFAPAIGPAISGAMTDTIGWHFTFLVMAILAIIIIIASTISMESNNETKSVTLDKTSVVLCVIGLFCLLYGFSLLGKNDTLIFGCGAIIIGAILLVVFSKRQLQLEQPFLQIGILKDKQFRTGVIILMMLSASLTAAMITLPFYMQHVRGLSATTSGMVMMPGAIIGAIAGFFAGNLSDKFGSRKLALIGIIIVIIGSAGMIFWDLNTSMTAITLIYCLRYLGLMLTNTPINLWAIGKLSNEKLGHGNAVSNTLRQIASTLGTTVMVSVMTIVTSVFSDKNNSQLIGIHATFYLCTAIPIICLFIVLLQVKGNPAKALKEQKHKI